MAPLQLLFPECAKMAASVNNFRFMALQWPWRRQRGRAIKRGRQGRRKKSPSRYASTLICKGVFCLSCRLFSFSDVRDLSLLLWNRAISFFLFLGLCSAIQTSFSSSSNRRKTTCASFYAARFKWLQTFASMNEPRRAVAHRLHRGTGEINTAVGRAEWWIQHPTWSHCCIPTILISSHLIAFEMLQQQNRTTRDFLDW